MKQKLELWPIASLIILSTLIELGIGKLTTKPLSAEAAIGQTIHFNCSTSLKSSEIQWFHYPIQENSQRQLVYGYGKMGPSYSRLRVEQDNATGAFNLVIPSVTLNDAGNYECQDDYGAGDKSNAQLIALELPVCESATELTRVVGKNNCGITPDQLLLSCIVQYKGNEPPVMKWRKLGERTTVDSRIPPTKLSDRIIYNITMDGASVSNGSTFECYATRAAVSTGCRTKNAIIISQIHLCFNCAVAIVIFTIVVLAIGAAIATLWYFFYFQKQKKEEKEKYEKYMDLVFCLNFIPFFIGAALGLYWYLRYYRPQKKQKEPDQWKDNREAELSMLMKDESNKGKQDVAVVEVKSTPEKPANSPTEKIRALEFKNKEQEKERQKLLTENEELKKKIQELEQELYSLDRKPMDYVDKPSVVHTINTEPGTKENRPIVGLAVLKNSLFVSHEKTPTIEVYDSATYVLQGQVGIPEMKDPLDIASCGQESCLFVIGWLKESSKELITGSHILKIKLNGEVVCNWESGGNSGRLSTYESNVIVCLSDKLLVCEFSHEGKLIRQVRLSPAAGFNNLSHAIKVTSMHFVISHGEKEDKLHRVCLVNDEGNIIEKFEGVENIVGRLEKAKAPVCLLNDKSRSILVADKEGSIILLNSNLKFKRKLIEKADFASRISFDETEKRLFVARNKVSSKKKQLEGQVLVFNVK